MTRTLGFISLLAIVAGVSFAATPPPLVNYEGVLRDPSGNPLSGTYDMVFRFMDTSTSGNEILTDQHLGGNAVVVSSGLFNVSLGSGTVADGTGPGTYTSLASVFRDFSAVWLEVQVGTETLSPRTRMVSAPYALNSTNAVTATFATGASDAGLLGGAPPSAFLNTSSTTQTKTGQLNLVNGPWYPGIVGVGINASGTNGGGFFTASDPGTYGVEGRGEAYGGYFRSVSGGSGLYAWGNTYGVEGFGAVSGGYFTTNISGVSAKLATDDFGIDARGTSIGGFFANGAPNFSFAQIPLNDKGINAQGTAIGGVFRNSSYGSYAEVAWYDAGIRAHGSVSGGSFDNFATSAWGLVGYSSYKILGNGAVSFVQNHPADPAKVIVYAAPEGDEVAVYTRGSGRLVGGEARVALGETFALVANPDIGLTATVTPTGEAIPLAVVEKSTHELIVRGPAGSNAAFDYVLWGLRIGFEEQSIIQPKQNDSKIPSMVEHERLFDAEPALRNHTALARFKEMETRVNGRNKFDFTNADQLRSEVGVFAPGPAGGGPAPEGLQVSTAPPMGGATDARPGVGASPSSPSEEMVAAHPEPEDAAAELHAVSPGGLNPSVILMTAQGIVEPGDVVSLDAVSPGAVVRSVDAADPLVIGCARAMKPGSVSDGLIAVATGNIALCRVDASYGAVGVGDRLVVSPSPGLAMRADPSSTNATVFGRAIDPLENGSGLIRVLVTVR